MNSEEIREYCIAKKGTTEGLPFDENILVFKVMNKIFLLFALDEFPLRFNVKCNPDKAIEQREKYPDVIFPGYHMNKKHWNTILSDGTLSEKITKQLIDDSYNLIVESLTKYDKLQLKNF